MYDLIIVGGGLAGLRVGIETLRQNTELKVCILEKYDYIGGRVITHYGHNRAQWEIGAYRIAESHKRILNLIKEYDLTWIEMNKENNKWSNLKQAYLDPLLTLPQEELAQNTIFDLIKSIHGIEEAHRFLIGFPYWSEVYRLRADLALKSFQNEMNGYKRFGICKEGLSALIKAMTKNFRQLGGKVRLNSEVVAVTQDGETERVLCKDGETIRGQVCVLALHRDAVAELKDMKRWSGIKHLTMEPLMRMYAIFPTIGGSWFTGLPSIVTERDVRFIIPIDDKIGTIMISYTDGADAHKWMRKFKAGGKDAVLVAVMRDIRAEFPDRIIPDPLEFKPYPWYSGCTYWTPGAYDPVVESNNALCVRDRLFCCGESWSLHQAWMEGAIEHADMLLADTRFNNALNRKNDSY